MKNKIVRYLIAFTVLLFLTLNLLVACTQPNTSPPPTPPKPPPTQPPIASENQTPEEAPPIDEAKNEEEWYKVETFSGEVDETTSTFHIHGTEWRINWIIDAEDSEEAIFELAIYPKDAPYAIWETVSNAGKSSGEVNYFLSLQDKRDFLINVTAKNLSGWTLIIEDNAPGPNPSPIKITHIHYLGTVYPPTPETGCYERVEPDEYVVIKNLSECYQDISGWVLKNISRPTVPSFTFPRFIPVLLVPGEIIRVYTDEYHLETGGFSFYYGTGDLWNNDKPNTAVLYDAQGNEISRKSYAVPTQINEPNE
ncbi:MAG: lamin tail domain-containing protein [Chloroflexota bacterium]|nr:MAG: lamin tail domain-containing protein [Chloroflexota bacterium]